MRIKVLSSAFISASKKKKYNSDLKRKNNNILFKQSIGNVEEVKGKGKRFKSSN